MKEENLSKETFAEEQQGTYTHSFSFSVTKESTISHYCVSNGDGGESWWEALFHTDNWGTMRSALQRYTGENFVEYKDKLKDLEKVLLDKYGVTAQLSPKNYRCSFKLDAKGLVRVEYAFKKRNSKTTDTEED